jgi:3'-phosphoadenosine 5'-phosphosulfate sulfotransferase (PAPS reductase)/FAD synthetase
MKLKYLKMNKEQRNELFNLPLEEKLKVTETIIKEALSLSKRPVVQFSGGADSCLMAYLVNQIDPNVPCAFNNWGLFLPKTKEFVLKFFKKYNIKHFINESGYDYEKFFKEKGYPIFKGVRSFMKKEDYPKYRITDYCRRLRHKCWNPFKKEYKPDLSFLGILAKESPSRNAIFSKYGFLMNKKGMLQVKPIALFTKPEVFKLLKDKKILWPKDSYEEVVDGEVVCTHNINKILPFGMHSSDLECFICPARLKQKGFGRWGRLQRNNPEVLKSIMNNGFERVLRDIIHDYPQESKIFRDFLDNYYQEKL